MTMATPKLHRSVLTAILDAVRAIFGEGAHAEQVVEETLRHQPKWGARDRRLFANTVYELVRWWRREAWRAGVPEAAALGAALGPASCARIWAAWWRDQGHEVPDFPELAAVARDPSAASDSPAPPPAVLASMPDWLYDQGAAAHGAAWPALVEALNQPADVFLRTNPIRASLDQVVAALAKEGVETLPGPDPARHPFALRLLQRRSLATTAAVRAGLFEVQDAGSQEIAPFLNPQPGELVIDSCAGGGGKALHLAALMKNEGRIIAMDVHAWKLAALEKRAVRAGASCIRTQTLTGPEDLARRAGTADRLLIDTPCSGTGVLRRHPDTKWKLTPAEVERLVRLQQELLDTHPAMLKPGGTLVYATCSLLPQENGEQIRAFLARQSPGAWSLDEEKLLLPAAGAPASNHDAFYMARLTLQNKPRP
jgi:16S rRNA (cytosine967-C5)-methyltransferase